MFIKNKIAIIGPTNVGHLFDRLLWSIFRSTVTHLFDLALHRTHINETQYLQKIFTLLYLVCIIVGVVAGTH